MEPEGTSFQSATALRNMVISTTNNTKPLYSRYRFCSRPVMVTSFFQVKTYHFLLRIKWRRGWPLPRPALRGISTSRQLLPALHYLPHPCGRLYVRILTLRVLMLK